MTTERLYNRTVSVNISLPVNQDAKYLTIIRWTSPVDDDGTSDLDQTTTEILDNRGEWVAHEIDQLEEGFCINGLEASKGGLKLTSYQFSKTYRHSDIELA